MAMERECGGKVETSQKGSRVFSVNGSGVLYALLLRSEYLTKIHKDDKSIVFSASFDSTDE